MKIIFFNVLDASIDENGIAQYIRTHKDTTDLFCFQETLQRLEKVLTLEAPEFKQTNAHKNYGEHEQFDSCTAVSPKHNVITTSPLLETSDHLGLGIYTKLAVQGTFLHVLNFHGNSRPGNKLDEPSRLEQSQKILEFFANLTGPKIIGGDFNLAPETQSVKMFEQSGYINLNKKFDIKNTRNENVWKLYPENKMYYSDYVFVTPDVKVESFEVPYNEISDHLPLELIFSL
jgi:endonuclease/exonuclease/phosphatase family metal-dependent hydrolase